MFDLFLNPTIDTDRLSDFIQRCGDKNTEVFFYHTGKNILLFANYVSSVVAGTSHITNVVLCFNRDVGVVEAQIVHDAIQKWLNDLEREIKFNAFKDIPNYIYKMVEFQFALEEGDIATAVQTCIDSINKLRNRLPRKTNLAQYFIDKVSIHPETAKYLAQPREPKYHAYETWRLSAQETEHFTVLIKNHIKEIQS